MNILKKLDKTYKEKTGITPDFHICQIIDGCFSFKKNFFVNFISKEKGSFAHHLYKIIMMHYYKLNIKEIH